MKLILAILAPFLSVGLYAQRTDSVNIKTSDPTQIYTFVETYSGLNFLKGFNENSLELDTWEVGVRGNLGIKKFRIGVYLPASNNAPVNRFFDDIYIDAGYQIHNNSGLYNATLINAGFSSPSQEGLFYGFNFSPTTNVYPNSDSFYKIHLNYIGAVKFSEKLSFYPSIEWFQRTNKTQEYIQLTDSGYYNPIINSRGWKFSGTISYDINVKNFLQFYAGWSLENWEGKYGSSDELNEEFSGFFERRLNLNLKYQYAISPFAQAYFKLVYNEYVLDHKTLDTYSVHPDLYSFQLGFTYFLH